jgi:hypothetical protein
VTQEIPGLVQLPPIPEESVYRKKDLSVLQGLKSFMTSSPTSDESVYKKNLSLLA